MQKRPLTDHSTFWQKGFLRKRNYPHPFGVSEFRSSETAFRISQKGNIFKKCTKISFLGTPMRHFGSIYRTPTPKLRRVGGITFAQKALLPKSRMLGSVGFL